MQRRQCITRAIVELAIITVFVYVGIRVAPAISNLIF